MLNKNYIHDIKPSSRVQKRRDTFARAHERRVHELEESFEPRTPEYATRRTGRGVWYIAVFAILALVFSLTFLFAKATVYVTPRTGTIELSGPILAQKQSRTGLGFEMVTVSSEKTASVEAGEKSHVETKAVGVVTLFNNNPTSQKLLIDTRLENKDGYIYKTKIATTIPAQKTEGSKKTPGTIDVEVYADEAGDTYNISEGDLKIVGFRGSPKYETVYAKIKTPIKGGFVGETYGVSEEELNSTKLSLENDLKTSLLEKAKTDLPSDFIMYENAVLFDFEDPVIGESTEEGMAEIKIAGKLNAVIFKEADLAKALVEKVIGNEEKVKVSNIRDLNIQLDKDSFISDPASMQDIKIVIDDKVEVVWEVNDLEIKEVLVSTKQREFENKMLQFKNITQSNLELKPFWKNTLPDDPGSIKIVNNLDK